MKYAGEAANDRAIEKEIRKAEKEVLAEFSGSNTTSVENAMLRQLDHALDTDVFEYDPMLDMQFDQLGDTDATRYADLTRRVIVNTYADLLRDNTNWSAASLGEEDVRWLQMLDAVESKRTDQT